MTGPLLIERTGPLVTVQDLGRVGWWSAGVGCAGAADRGALRLANRLVGNPEDAAGLEILFGGVVIRAQRRLTVAVTGAPAPADVDGMPVGHASVLELGAGARLQLGLAMTGVRAYLSVRGGVDVPAVLGSRSYDTLSGLGPEPVRPGTALPVGPPPSTYPLLDVAPVTPPTAGVVRARVMLGPRDDWFDQPTTLFEGQWQATTKADRVGLRLARNRGQRLLRAVDGELPSEGAALGSIQVPPDGRPVVLLADHPITGGYPVVGVVIDADVDRMAQVRPGQLVEFVRVLFNATPSSASR